MAGNVRIDPNDVLIHPRNWAEITFDQAMLRSGMFPMVLVTHENFAPYARLMTGNWGLEWAGDSHPRFYTQVGPFHMPTAKGPVAHTMALSAKGRAVLRHLEGLGGLNAADGRYYPYLDTGRHPTMGIGHLIDPKKDAGRGFAKGYTLKQVEDLFTEDIGVRAKLLNAQLKMGVSQQQFDALMMFSFNVGNRKKPPFDPIRVLNAGGAVTGR